MKLRLTPLTRHRMKRAAERIRSVLGMAAVVIVVLLVVAGDLVRSVLPCSGRGHCR